MYLILSDLRKSIQAENLTQIIGADSTILTSAELTAIEEASSYLVQRYDLAEELQDTTLWDKTKTYVAGNRVYIDAPAFSPLTGYASGVYVLYEKNIYKSNTTVAAGSFDKTQWDFVCSQYQIFYAELPFPKFNIYTRYDVGNKVSWKGKTYTCIIASPLRTLRGDIQDMLIEAAPLPNVFPDNPSSGLQYWGAGTAYTVPANTDILNSAWTQGDNRSQQLITYIVDIALYHIHSRVAPRNIPDLRVKRYDDAKKWLKMAGEGKVNAQLPVLQPKQGNRTRYGGNVKNQNTY